MIARPAVSVLLPTHDAAPTLATAIQSIRSQSLPDWELIIIDDGSLDDSPLIAGSHAREDPRIRVLRLPRTGIAGALNAGLAAARAPLIARMDADDVSDPDRLAVQAAFLLDHPRVGVVGSRVAYGGDTAANAGYALHVDWLNHLIDPDDIALARFIESPFAHPSVMFRSHLPREHGGYLDGDFPEDYELWLRWLDAGVRMAKVPQTLLTWNDPPERLSRRDPRYRAEAFFRIKAGYLARHLASLHPSRPRIAWGAGRLTRRRIGFFEAAGIPIHGFIDIDPRKQHPRPDGRQVLAPDHIPPPGQAIVLGCVANRGARDFQRAFLTARGHVEGRDFLFAA